MFLHGHSKDRSLLRVARKCIFYQANCAYANDWTDEHNDDLYYFYTPEYSIYYIYDNCRIYYLTTRVPGMSKVYNKVLVL